MLFIGIFSISGELWAAAVALIAVAAVVARHEAIDASSNDTARGSTTRLKRSSVVPHSNKGSGWRSSIDRLTTQTGESLPKLSKGCTGRPRYSFNSKSNAAAARAVSSKPATTVFGGGGKLSSDEQWRKISNVVSTAVDSARNAHACQVYASERLDSADYALLTLIDELSAVMPVGDLRRSGNQDSGDRAAIARPGYALQHARAVGVGRVKPLREPAISVAA